jgi:metallophosphoesterase superfamily enzyme
VVLGKYVPEESPFHAEVLKAASDEVVFPGAIYDSAVVEALRLNSLFYIHGHQVGGTNPSLLEAMGAGNAVLAHDNPFNRWVVGKGAVFFRDRSTCSVAIEQMLSEKCDLAAMPAVRPIPSGPNIPHERFFKCFRHLCCRDHPEPAQRVRPCAANAQARARARGASGRGH